MKASAHSSSRIGWVGLTAASGLLFLLCTFFGVQLFGTFGVAQAAVSAPLTLSSGDDHYVDRTEWVRDGDRPSLRVFPTASGRHGAVELISADDAWAEVVALNPDADQPGMRDQFVCHWRFAEIAHPGKSSWNLEPWRPTVDGATMLTTRCNPGGAEERI